MLEPETMRRLREEREVLAYRVRGQLAQLDRLEQITRSLAARVEADRRLLDELDGALGLSPQLRLESLDEQIRGQRLEEIAIAILREEVGELAEIHYREWFEMLRARGHRVAGQNPLGTFLAQINRSALIERVGKRTGRYRLSLA